MCQIPNTLRFPSLQRQGAIFANPTSMSVAPGTTTATASVTGTIDSAETKMSSKEGVRLCSPLFPYTAPYDGCDEFADCTAMIILNTPISKPPSKVFEHLWNASQLRICADGGANRLYDATHENSNEVEPNGNARFIPDGIRGDLDSLRDDVKEYYKSKGVPVERDPSQMTNDLTKALEKVVAGGFDPDKPKTTFRRVLIYGAFGGRFDQEMASINALFRWGNTFNHQMWLYTDETFAVLVPANKKVEFLLPCYNTTLQVRDGPTCGLIPIGCRCDSMTTTGFRWNLQDTPSEFGGLVSSSNDIPRDDTISKDGNCVVTIEVSHPIIFTTEILTAETRDGVKS